jgi:hypothetical protein
MPVNSTKKLQFASFLPARYLRDLEKLLFFSCEQHSVVDGIRLAVHLYGIPKILRRKGALRVVVGCHDAQNLFVLESDALRDRVVGTVVTIRDPLNSLTVVHLAVADGYAMRTTADSYPLALRMFKETLKIARQINGIDRVRILYGRGQILHIRTNLAESWNNASLIR